MSGSTRLAVYIVGGALLAAGVYMFLLRPSLDRVSQLAEHERATRAEVHRLEQQILAYKTAQSDLSKATGKDLLYNTAVDDKKLYVPIEEMEASAAKTASTHQLKILRDSLIAPSANPSRRTEEFVKITEQTALEEVPYVLSVQNVDYSKFVNFIQYLENIPHFTEVSKIDLLWMENPDSGRAELNGTINGVWLAKKNAN